MCSVQWLREQLESGPSAISPIERAPHALQSHPEGVLCKLHNLSRTARSTSFTIPPREQAPQASQLVQEGELRNPEGELRKP